MVGLWCHRVRLAMYLYVCVFVYVLLRTATMKRTTKQANGETSIITIKCMCLRVYLFVCIIYRLGNIKRWFDIHEKVKIIRRSHERHFVISIFAFRIVCNIIFFFLRPVLVFFQRYAYIYLFSDIYCSIFVNYFSILIIEIKMHCDVDRLHFHFVLSNLYLHVIAQMCSICQNTHTIVVEWCDGMMRSFWVGKKAANYFYQNNVNLAVWIWISLDQFELSSVPISIVINANTITLRLFCCVWLNICLSTKQMVIEINYKNFRDNLSLNNILWIMAYENSNLF